MPRKSEPTERQCAVTREVQPVSALIRFVLDPQGEVVPDLKRVLPGRGVWITATKEVVAVAEKDRKKVFGRGFKGKPLSSRDWRIGLMRSWNDRRCKRSP